MNVGLNSLRVVGIITWAIVGIPAVLSEVERGALATPRVFVWLAAYFAFAALFWTNTRRDCSRTERWISIPLQTLCWVVCLVLNPSGFLAVLIVIVAAELGSESLGIALGWIVLQMILQIVISASFGAVSIWNALAYFGFQLFAVYASRTAHSEAEARRRLAEAHTELQVAAGLLEINSRAEERLRIARELHDLLGHHLTALSLNLEVASHLTSGAAKEHVDKSHALTRVLLTDVREVVSQLRDREPVDVAHAARSLADAVSKPRIHVDAPEHLPVADRVGRAALRTLQEIVTNSVRHSEARNLWLRLEESEGMLRIEGRDDGGGTDLIRFGNGLSGMRERVQEAGGRFEVESRRGGGFLVRVELPAGVIE